jgi:hypothetical protein
MNSTTRYYSFDGVVTYWPDRRWTAELTTLAQPTACYWMVPGWEWMHE